VASEKEAAGDVPAGLPRLLSLMLALLGPVGLEFFRFGMVGTAGFLVDAGILQLCLSVFGLGPYVGRAISFAVGATFTWFCNRHFTFRRRRGGMHWFRQWWRFVALMLLGGGLNYGTYAALIRWVPPVAAYPVLGVAAGSIAGMLVNFTTARLFVFRHRPASPAGQGSTV